MNKLINPIKQIKASHFSLRLKMIKILFKFAFTNKRFWPTEKDLASLQNELVKIGFKNKNKGTR